MGKGSFLGEIERRTGRSVTAGSVYSTLSRLEEKGFTTSYEGEATPRRGGRARRHVKLEPAGVQALEASRGMLDAMWGGVDLEKVEGA